MPISITMPALSPTMEEGTLARWLVKPGDKVASGDIMAEIETDKATMEFEAADEGTIVSIAVSEGTEGVKVGTVIATLAGEDEDADALPATTPAPAATPNNAQSAAQDQPAPTIEEQAKEAREEDFAKESQRTQEPVSDADAKSMPQPAGNGAVAFAPASAAPATGERIKASPLARRIAAQAGVDLAGLTGTGPGGRIVRADVEAVRAKPAAAPQQAAAAQPAQSAAPAQAPADAQPAPMPAKAGDAETGTPFVAEKLSNIRKVIARRLTEAKREVPHYYLTVDIHLDPLLALRQQLNASLEADGVKLSVNDLLIKALARALMRVPQCNVSFHGEELHRYTRADISVAVASPKGLITPIITEADTRGLAAISTAMKELIARAGEGKLQPHEYQGGSASLSNLGMFGIKQFDAVINPPQSMIMAVGAGEKRPYVLNGELQVATVMSASVSFDHRAIDGADGAQLMAAFKQLCEQPMGLVV